MSRVPGIGDRVLYEHVITEHDWPEDFSEENGNYTCTCVFCNATFVGYKGRIVCKYCACMGASNAKTALSAETEEMLRAYAVERMHGKRSRAEGIKRMRENTK